MSAIGALADIAQFRRCYFAVSSLFSPLLFCCYFEKNCAIATAYPKHLGPHNERPTWLTNAHRDLDAAVAAAYCWPADISEGHAVARLLPLHLVPPAPV